MLRSGEAFRQRLGDCGYIEGGNITVEYRDADGKADRLSDQAAESVCINVELIVKLSRPSLSNSKNSSNITHHHCD